MGRGVHFGAVGLAVDGVPTHWSEHLKFGGRGHVLPSPQLMLVANALEITGLWMSCTFSIWFTSQVIVHGILAKAMLVQHVGAVLAFILNIIGVVIAAITWYIFGGSLEMDFSPYRVQAFAVCFTYLVYMSCVKALPYSFRTSLLLILIPCLLSGIALVAFANIAGQLQGANLKVASGGYQPEQVRGSATLFGQASLTFSC